MNKNNPNPQTAVPEDTLPVLEEDITIISEDNTQDGRDSAEHIYLPLSEIFAEENTEKKVSETKAEEVSGPPQKRKGRNIITALLSAAAAAAIITCGILLGLLYYFSPPITVDLDEAVSIGILETHPILSALTTSENPPSSIDTSTISDQTLLLTFFGFIPRTVPVSVRDLTPPAVQVCNLTMMAGMDITAEECVTAYHDKTAVSFAFATAPDTNVTGLHRVTLLAEDEGGNITETPVSIDVIDDALAVAAEFGSDADRITALIKDAYPKIGTVDLSRLDLSVCGTYRVTADTADENTHYLLQVVIADTTPPDGRSHSFDLFAGSTLTPEQFVTNLSDASDVTLSYKNAPDFTSNTHQTVVITAEDAHGNQRDFTCELQIWDISEAYTLECGTTLADFKSALFSDVPDGAALPTLDASFDPAVLAPGTYRIRLHGAYSTLRVTLTAQDTTAPTLSVKPVTAYIGAELTPESFVAVLKDATDVTLSFAAAPDLTRAGKETVVIRAVDAGGNHTDAEAVLTVIADTTAPVIYGVQTLYVKENSTISYRTGITAYDNCDGAVRVQVDASGVDISKSGTYTVIYTATDKAGNTATQSARVVVTGANEFSVNMYADSVLASILTKNMTERQKASAIYTWCVGHLRYSTATSHLMGNYLEAAYSGFTTKAGNCYTYYAVAAALLTCAGIENIEIHRNSTASPHYWNLVKIDGSWYHLDTCPKLPDYPIKTFLLTDKQLADYNKYQVAGYYSFDASLYPATP